MLWLQQICCSHSSLLAAGIILVLLGIPAYLSRSSGWTIVHAAIIEYVGWGKPLNNFVEHAWEEALTNTDCRSSLTQRASYGWWAALCQAPLTQPA